MDYRSTLASVSDSLDEVGQSLFVAAGSLGDVLISILLALYRAITAQPVGAALFVLFYLAYRFLLAGLGPVPRRERDRRYAVGRRPLDLMRRTVPGALFLAAGFGLFWWAQPAFLGSLMMVPVIAGGFGLVLLGCRFYWRAAQAFETARAEFGPASPPSTPAAIPDEAPRFVDPLEGIAAVEARRPPRVGAAVPVLRVAFPLGLVLAGLVVIFGALGSFSGDVAARQDLERVARREAVANLDDSLAEAVSAAGDAFRASGEPTEQAHIPLP